MLYYHPGISNVPVSEYITDKIRIPHAFRYASHLNISLCGPVELSRSGGSAVHCFRWLCERSNWHSCCGGRHLIHPMTA